MINLSTKQVISHVLVVSIDRFINSLSYLWTFLILSYLDQNTMELEVTVWDFRFCVTMSSLINDKTKGWGLNMVLHKRVEPII